MGKLHSVQHLRACAALLVLVAHSFSHQIGADDPFVVLAGRLGVVLFFVISGFIMVTISGSGPFSAPVFLKRRAIRIVPLYWLFTGLAALLAMFAPALFKTTVFTWPHFLQSALFIVHEAPERGDASPLLSLGWTLNYEVYFYVAFAALSFLFATARVLVLSICFVAAWAIGLLTAPTDPVLQFYLSSSPLAFVAGAWLGWHHLRGNALPHRRNSWMLGLLAAAGVLLALGDDGTRVMGQVGFFGQVACSVSLLLLGLVWEAKLKRWSLLEALGDASYALYLSHIFVIGAVVHLAGRMVGTGGPATVLLVSVTSIAVACAASIVIHKAVEKPISRILNGKRKAAEAPLRLAATYK